MLIGHLIAAARVVQEHSGPSPDPESVAIVARRLVSSMPHTRAKASGHFIRLWRDGLLLQFFALLVAVKNVIQDELPTSKVSFRLGQLLGRVTGGYADVILNLLMEVEDEEETYLPTLEEISDACMQIRSEWTPEQFRERQVFGGRCGPLKSLRVCKVRRGRRRAGR